MANPTGAPAVCVAGQPGERGDARSEPAATTCADDPDGSGGDRHPANPDRLPLPATLLHPGCPDGGDQRLTEIIDTIARACRILGKLEVTYAALGHVSYRLGDS